MSKKKESQQWRCAASIRLSQDTFYSFKLQNDVMELSDAARLRAIKDETAKLIRLLANTMLGKAVLKRSAGKFAQRDYGDLTG